jgi:formimidoylglutamate deiminase
MGGSRLRFETSSWCDRSSGAGENGENPIVAAQLSIPGFVNVHSHGFQRALRGRASGGDFWAWRETMLSEAERQTPESVRDGYEDVYRAQRSAGYTAVGEFHYLGYDEALAAAEAARAADIELVVLYAAYGRGGIDRFRQGSVTAYLRAVEALLEAGIQTGLAPHSVRACPADWLTEIGRYADSSSLPLHVHACEQPREIAECLDEHGRRPIELLADTGCLGPRTTIVHATHADDGELDLIADAGARVCICPTTEADLGDGFAPLRRLLERSIPLCIGSDSNVRIDPFEELRELDAIARRETLARDAIDPAVLVAIGAENGAAALEIDAWPQVAIDLAHESLRGLAPDAIPASLVWCGSADVVV